MENPWKIIAIVFIVLFASTALFSFFGASLFEAAGSSSFSKSAPNATARAEVAVDFIRTNLIGSDATIQMVNVTEESGAYRIFLNYSSAQKDQETLSVFMSKDGKYLFPTAIPVDGSKAAVSSSTDSAAKAQTCADLKKQDTPLLEAFVVSYCPYGTQMQGVLANVVSNIPTLGAHIKVRYIGEITNGTVQSMHGSTEAAENLRQICIREEQPDLYWNYVSCFLNSTSSESCLKSTGVNMTKLSECTSDATRGLRYAQADFNLSDSYGVTGSPTLVLNGVTVSEFNFGGRSPDAVKSMLCCGFTTKPDSCATNLSSSTAGTQGNC